MKLKDKIALVTGGSQGVGRGIAERAQEALSAIEATGRRGLVVQAEGGSTDGVKKLFATALEHFGRLILVRTYAKCGASSLLAVFRRTGWCE